MAMPTVEEEPIGKSAVLPLSQLRRKLIGLRTWLVVSKSGESRPEEVDKHWIMRLTGLPARDLRVLDPGLSYPSSILGRERAIVVNLEHIKAIITAEEILVVNSSNPLVAQFVQELQHRISLFNYSSQQQESSERNEMDMEDVAEATESSASLRGHHVSAKNLSNRKYKTSDNQYIEMPKIETNNDSPNKIIVGAQVAVGPKLLPFEFRALEACLESACKCLESETEILEKEAYPALDELTLQISLNIERVRLIKSRLVALYGRVQKVRDELEHLLDDDNDMAEMYLTDKLVACSLDQTELEADEERNEETESENNSEMFTGSKPNIEELEMLFEAYFAQTDGCLQKLSSMREYVEDTEDYITIMLDDKQNRMLEMALMMGAANVIINVGVVLFAVFGVNIQIDLFEEIDDLKFWIVTAGSVGGSLILYFVGLAWAKRKYHMSL